MNLFSRAMSHFAVLYATFLALVAEANGREISNANGVHPRLGCAPKTSAMVSLFEWRWDDIEKECPRLATIGYCSVQTSIANEHAVVEGRPWWERYQPVSYKLVTRSGNEQQFASMVKACNAVGVRVVVDVVLNHMAKGEGVGTAGTPYNSTSLSYPGAGYTEEDFHKEYQCNHPGKEISSNYSTPVDYRLCSLYGLPDLDQSRQNVRAQMSSFLDRLIGLGVAGFRLDSAKYIFPHDLKAILDHVRDTHWGTRPFVYSQVSNLLKDEVVRAPEYYDLGLVSDFKRGANIAKAFITQSRSLIGLPAADKLFDYMAVDFVDMQTFQRGILEGSKYYLNYKSPVYYQKASAVLLLHSKALPRIMSSYEFTDADHGPPLQENGEIARVPFDDEYSCGNGWVCEHRWPLIQKLVQLRNDIPLNDFSNHMRISQRRNIVIINKDSRLVVAFTTDGEPFKGVEHFTRFPEGSYCDVFTNCSTEVSVDHNGVGTFSLSSDNLFVGIMNNSTRPPFVL